MLQLYNKIILTLKFSTLRDIEETSERISQKATQFASAEGGRDLEAAHELRRRHVARAAEASAIADRMKVLKGEGGALAKR